MPNDQFDSGGQTQALTLFPGDGPGKDPVGKRGIISLCVWSLLLSLFVLYSLYAFWPSQGPTLGAAPASRPAGAAAPKTESHGSKAPESQPSSPPAANPTTQTATGGATTGRSDGDGDGCKEIDYFWATVQLGAERQLFLLVLFAGALGSLVHVLRSLYWYVGMRDLRQSWAMMYLLLPFSGATLAMLFYFMLRGGLFPQAKAADNTPYGFVAVACLVGLFSQQAVLKLKDVAETIFTKPAPGADAKPQGAQPLRPGGTAGPVAAAASFRVTPDSGARTGGDQVTIAGTGTAFTSATTVTFGTAAAPNVKVTSPTQLMVTTPPGPAGDVDVTVVTPSATPSKVVGKFKYT